MQRYNFYPQACYGIVYLCTHTEKFSAQKNGLTVYLRDQSARILSIANPPVQMTLPGTPLLSPVTWNSYWTRPGYTQRLR